MTVKTPICGTYGDLCEQVHHDAREANRLRQENAELREWCAELLQMAETHDPEWLHWPELHDELRKLGVWIAKKGGGTSD